MELRAERGPHKGRHSPFWKTPADVPCCWDRAGPSRLPPVPRMPCGRPVFLLSQPQLHEPWFFKPASSAPVQLRSDPPSDLSNSSELITDLSRSLEPRSDLSNSFNTRADLDRDATSERSRCGGGPPTPVNLPASPELYGRLVVSRSCSLCFVSSTGRLYTGLTLPPLKTHAKSNSPTPTFTCPDEKLSEERERSGWCGCWTVTATLTLVFCASFLLALAGAIAYIEGVQRSS